jgi:hypothetical protein
MTKFFEAAKAKFDKGAEEHGQPWGLEHINHVEEIKDELLDLYNYASLDSKLWWICTTAENIWNELDRGEY